MKDVSEENALQLCFFNFRQDGHTALTHACKNGHLEIVQMLLQSGAYVNLPDRVF